MFQDWAYHCQHHHDHRTDPSVRQPVVDPIDPPSASQPTPTVDSSSSSLTNAADVRVGDPAPASPPVSPSKQPRKVRVNDKFESSRWNNCTISEGLTVLKLQKNDLESYEWGCTPVASSSSGTGSSAGVGGGREVYYSVCAGRTVVATTSRYVHSFLSCLGLQR